MSDHNKHDILKYIIFGLLALLAVLGHLKSTGAF